MRTALTRWARAGGIALALLCAAYVAWRWRALHAGAPSITLAPTLAAAALYALCGLPLALAWLAALRAAGERSLPALAVLAGYLQTQIAKYLPGGILHYAARHAHGRGKGAGHRQLGAAAMLETMSLVLAASLFLPALVPPALVLPSAASTEAGSALALLYALRWLPLAVALAACALALLRWHATPAALGLSAVCLALHLLFFLLSAAVCAVLMPAWPATLGVTAFAAAVAGAWLAGFVVIGAPGGLGVREAVLVALLGPLLGEGPALGVAVSYRLATMGGDLAMAAAGLALTGLARPPAGA